MKSNIKLKKALALTSAVAVLASGSSATMLSTVVSAAEVSVNASSTGSTDGVATEMKIYNADGKDISINSVTTISNSECNQVNHEFTFVNEYTDNRGRPCFVREMGTTFTVMIDDPNDVLVLANNNSNLSKVKNSVSILDEGDGVYVVKVVTKRVSAYFDDSGDSVATSRKLVVETVPEGETSFVLTTASGNVYRTLKISVTQPISSLTTKVGDVTVASIVKQDGVSTLVTEGFLSIANHPQSFTSKITGSSTDGLEYIVTRGSNLTEISEDGVFTPKKNGWGYIKIQPKNGVELYIARTVTKELGTIMVGEKEKKVTGRDYEYDKIDFENNQIQFVIVKENPAKSLKFIAPPSTLNLKEKATLTLEKVPTYNSSEYATSATDTITWTSSNKNIITVDDKGNITAKSTGVATIKAQGENSKVYAECTISVVAPATSVKINENPILVTKDGVATISATMTPTSANETVTWASDDESIVTVTPTGDTLGNTQTAEIKGVAVGTTTVTATTQSGKQFIATVTVTDKISVGSFKVTKGTTVINNSSVVEVYNGQSVTLKGQTYDTKGNAVDDDIKWTVVDKGDIVSYSPSNNSLQVKGISNGVVTVVATSTLDPSYKRTFTIKVLRSADSVAITNKNGVKISSINLLKGSTLQLSALLTFNNDANNHDDKVIGWNSSDTSVAKVSSTGLVSPQGVGTAVITVGTASGKTAKCKVTVKVLSRIAIEYNNTIKATQPVTMSKDDATIKLVFKAYDENNKLVNGLTPKWSSSNTGVAEVATDGTVTLHKIGVAEITARAGNRQVRVTLNVKAPITSCEIEKIADIPYVAGKATYNPKTVVKYKGVTLERGNTGDYIVNYTNNTDIGTSYAVIKSRSASNFTGEKKVSFKIVQKNITNSDYVDNTGITVSGVSNKTYTGSAVTFTDIKVYDTDVNKKKVLLTEGVDYSISYKNNINAGTGSVIITGKGNYKGTYTKTFTIIPANINSVSGLIFTLDKTSYDYTGKEIKPTVKGTLNGVSFRNFTVEYKNNINVGTGSVVITGKGNYKGSIIKTFKINAVLATKITLNKSTASISKGSTVTLTATITPTNTTNKNVTWTSSNNSIATVTVTNGKCVVTGKTVGTVTITAKTSNGKTATCKITVK